MGRKLKAVGAMIVGLLIVASYIYVDNQGDAIAMLWPVILIVFALEVAVFVYFLIGALWIREGRDGGGRVSRYLSLIVYVLLTVFTYAIFKYEPVTSGDGAVTEYFLLLTVSASIVSRIFLVMFWFSLLPAWLLAVRMRTDATRYFLLWGGYLVFFAPVWLAPWEADGGPLLKPLSVASTVLFAGAVTLLVRKLEGKSRDSADGALEIT